MEKLYDNVDVPPYETVRLDSSNFEFFAFVPYDDSLSAVAADALVNITPHSVVVIRAENGNGASLVKKVVENADPNKWLCVGSLLVVPASNHDPVSGIAPAVSALPKKTYPVFLPADDRLGRNRVSDSRRPPPGS